MPQGLFEPLWSGPSRFGRRLADLVDPVATRDRSYVGEPMMDETIRRTRSMIAGGLEGAGDIASDFTSPFSIGLTALGMAGPKAIAGSASRLGRTGSVVEGASGAVKGGRAAVNYGQDAAELGQLYDRMGPEFVPIGGEEAFNAVRGARVAAEKAKVGQMAQEAEQAYRRQHGFGRNVNMADDAAEQEFREVMSRRADAKKRPRAPMEPSEGRWTAKDISDAMSGMGPTEGSMAAQEAVPGLGVGPSAGGLERAMQAIERQKAIEMARQRTLRMRPMPSHTPLPEDF